jgi:2-phospho-L-lactate guanylyltransferase
VNWTAVIPLKGRGERKTRLGGRLSPQERKSLSHKLFTHVAAILSESECITTVMLLSDERPDDWTGDFALDQGRGLNAELKAIARSLAPQPMLVIHADLPFLTVQDIAFLLEAGGHGCAIAPDRHGEGTNALALVDPSGFEFSFGPASFTRHRAEARQGADVVTRLGLGLDIDTPDDLDSAIALGFAP